MHVWDPVCAPAQGLVRPVRIDPTGKAGPTRKRAAGPRWRRTSQGFYVPAGTDSSVPEQRILEQSVRLPPEGAVTGWAGLRLHRVGLVDGRTSAGDLLPVPLLVGSGGRIRGGAQVRLVYLPIPAWEVVTCYGIRTARLARCVHDAMRLAADEREALVVLEMALASKLISLERVRAYAAKHRGQHGQGKIDFALRYGIEESRSPYETRLRLLWLLDALLPPVLANRDVLSPAGKLLGIADLLDLEAGLVVEFDGADHRGWKRHTQDVGKQEAFFEHGLEVCRVTGTDMRDPASVVRRLIAARARALRLRRERTWVLGPRGQTNEELLQAQEDQRLYNHWAESMEMPSIAELERM